MSLRRWHWGKLVILWSWGGVSVALAVTVFLTHDPTTAPVATSVAFLGSIALLVVLSSVTWRWLGGKENKEKKEEER